MAKNTLMRLEVDSKSKAYHALGLLCIALLMQKSGGREFQVGGKGNWGVSTDNTSLDYNQWAERSRFQIGDSIVFNYASGKDSVLLVNKDAYTNCSIEYPMERYTDGHTVFTFKQSGSHYFISGNRANCLNNEKLIVIVLAERSNRSSNETTGTSPSLPPSPSSDLVPAPAPATGASPSPPPSPSSDVAPTPAPANGTRPSPPPSPSSVVPAPAPATETIPSPPLSPSSPAPADENSPPEGTVEANPTPAPEPNNKPNAASSNFISLVSSMGAFAASSLLLPF